MPRIVNGNASSPVLPADKTDLQTLLSGPLAGNPSPTFDEIRAAAPAGKRARMTDGLIAQVAAELGIEVKPE